MKRLYYGMVVAAGMAMGMTQMTGCSGKAESEPLVRTTAPVPAIETPGRKAESVKSQTMSTEMRYANALRLFDEGSYYEAETEFEKVCGAWPKFSKPFKHLARTQLKLEKFGEALENALEAVELNPKDGTIDNVIGMAYMELDDFDSAEESFKTAIQKSPEFPWSYNNLGYLRIRKSDFAGAKDILTEGGKLAKAPATLFNNLGIAMEKSGDMEAARAAYTKAVDLDPKHASAALNLARLGGPAECDSTTAQMATESR